MQRVADLEPQRVARAEAAGHCSAGEHGVPERLRLLVGAAELDPRLARVAGARDHHLDPVELTHLVGECGLLGEPEPLERPRALDGDEPVLVGRVPDLRAAGLAVLEPREHRAPVRGVADDQILAVRKPIDDEVVDDPAQLVREERVLRAAVLDLVEIVREHLLEEGVRGRPVDVDVAHVRDVEGAAVRAHRAMLLDHAGVLDGHLVARERHHPRPERDVARVERRALERRGLHACDSIRSHWRPDPGGGRARLRG